MKKEKINQQDEQVITDAVRLLKSDFVELYEGLGHDRTEAGMTWHTVRVSTKGQALRAKLSKGAPQLQALTFIGDMKDEVKERLKNKLKGKSTATEVQVEPQAEVEEKKVVVEATQGVGSKAASLRAKIKGRKTETVVVAPVVSDGPPEDTDEQLQEELVQEETQQEETTAEPVVEVQEELKPEKKVKAKVEKPVKEEVEGEKKKGKRGEKQAIIRQFIAEGITDVNTLVEKTGASKLYISWVLKNPK